MQEATLTLLLSLFIFPEKNKRKRKESIQEINHAELKSPSNSSKRISDSQTNTFLPFCCNSFNLLLNLPPSIPFSSSGTHFLSLSLTFLHFPFFPHFIAFSFTFFSCNFHGIWRSTSVEWYNFLSRSCILFLWSLTGFEGQLQFF
jgi:hypothetical protein